MGLPHPRRTEQEDIASFLNEPERGEFGNLLAIDGGLEVEVKRIEPFVDGIPCKAEASVNLRLEVHHRFTAKLHHGFAAKAHHPTDDRS
jgi:hypothetical protein